MLRPLAVLTPGLLLSSALIFPLAGHSLEATEPWKNLPAAHPPAIPSQDSAFNGSDLRLEVDRQRSERQFQNGPCSEDAVIYKQTPALATIAAIGADRYNQVSPF